MTSLKTRNTGHQSLCICLFEQSEVATPAAVHGDSENGGNGDEQSCGLVTLALSKSFP